MIEELFTRDPWPHQRDGVASTIDALSNGTKSVCLTAPTGAGKTQMQIALAQWGAKSGKVLCLTNRILLTKQTQRVFRDSGVPVGVISSSMKWAEREDCQVQIATIQTILARRRAADHLPLRLATRGLADVDAFLDGVRNTVHVELQQMNWESDE